MLEPVYDTILAIMYHELPKNAQGQPVVYGKIITGFNIGDRTVQADQPQVTIQGKSSKPEEIATGTYRVTHTINIGISVAAAKTELSERHVLEFARNLWEVMLRHRRIWVLEMCPICKKLILNPQHFTIEHSSVFGAYATAAQAEANAIWYETHALSDTAPTWEAPNLAAVAFLQVLAAVKANDSVPNLSAAARAIFAVEIAKKMRPIRLLDDVKYSDVTPSSGDTEVQMYRSGEFTMEAAEIYRQVSFGPNNVPTSAYPIPKSR